MELYRYVVYSDKKEHESFSGYGILTSLDYIFDDDTIIDLTHIFLDELPDPDCDMRDTVSYFTKKGNRKFNKAIRNLKKALQEKGFKIITVYENYENLNVIYEDVYQVVASTL